MGCRYRRSSERSQYDQVGAETLVGLRWRRAGHRPTALPTALWRRHHGAPGNHVSPDLWRVYRIGSTVTGPEGRRRAAVRAASVSVGNDSASFSGPQAAEGNLRVSQTECPPGYLTRITNMGKSPLACNSTAAPVHDLETIAWRRPSGIVHLDGSPGPNAAEAKQF